MATLGSSILRWTRRPHSASSPGRALGSDRSLPSGHLGHGDRAAAFVRWVPFLSHTCSPRVGSLWHLQHLLPLSFTLGSCSAHSLGLKHTPALADRCQPSAGCPRPPPLRLPCLLPSCPLRPCGRGAPAQRQQQGLSCPPPTSASTWTRGHGGPTGARRVSKQSGETRPQRAADWSESWCENCPPTTSSAIRPPVTNAPEKTGRWGVSWPLLLGPAGRRPGSHGRAATRAEGVPGRLGSQSTCSA